MEVMNLYTKVYFFPGQSVDTYYKISETTQV